jgi:hypothetical protein
VGAVPNLQSLRRRAASDPVNRLIQFADLLRRSKLRRLRLLDQALMLTNCDALRRSNLICNAATRNH